MRQSPSPFPIPPTFHEKVWGRPREGLRLGEIWFRARPLLLKFIFTTAKLSVQVHPGDEYARCNDDSAGKTECWYVIDAEPGAQLAVGFRRPLEREQILESLRDHTIERELNWLDMHPGDFVFVPHGTVHAIGAGLTLCEVQQFSDVTYRLYDYGRPRELHLDKALDVIRCHPAAGRIEAAPTPACGPGLLHHYLAGCRHFAIERFSATQECSLAIKPAGEGVAGSAPFEILVFLRGGGEILVAGDRSAYRREEMWRLPAGLGTCTIRPSVPSEWLRVYMPARLEGFASELERAGVPAEDRRRIIIEDV